MSVLRVALLEYLLNQRLDETLRSEHNYYELKTLTFGVVRNAQKRDHEKRSVQLLQTLKNVQFFMQSNQWDIFYMIKLVEQY